MRIAASMWSLVSEARMGRLDAPAFVRYAAGIGVEGVELLDVFWRDQGREEPQALDALAETGLPVSAYAIGNDLVQPDPHERARQVRHILAGVDTARRLGTGLLRVFSGSAKEGASAEQGRRWIVEGLREGAAYAAAHGVILALENHGLFAGRADQVRGIVDEVGSAALRATIDTGNFLLVEQDPAVAARELASLAAYVHLKDFAPARDDDHPDDVYTSLGGRRFAGRVIGDGAVRLDAVLGALRDAGYEGWLSIEYEGAGDARGGLERSVAAARLLVAGASPGRVGPSDTTVPGRGQRGGDG